MGEAANLRNGISFVAKRPGRLVRVSYPHTHEGRIPSGKLERLRHRLRFGPCGFVGNFPPSLLPITASVPTKQIVNSSRLLFLPMWSPAQKPRNPLTHIPTSKLFIAVLRTVRNNALSALNSHKHCEENGGNQRQKTKFRAQKNQPASWFVCGGRL